MRGEYLLVLFIVCNSGLLNARRGDTGSGSQDCRRTNRVHYRLCTKACSSDTDCGKNRKCLCDGDCGFSCVKNNLRCPVLPRPRNASQIISNSNSFRSVVTYTCKSPYKLRGSEKRTCRAIGKWDGKNAKCRIVCKDPGEITHGRRRYNGFQVGRSIFYWCFEGYVLKGSAVITCSKAGKWKNEKPRCVSLDDLVECNPPKMAEGAAILFPRKIPKKFKYNERVVLKCKNGYFKLGSGFQTCTRSGTWTSGTTCNPKSCGRPDDVIDGEIIGRVFTFKSRVNYTCHVGYELDGPAYRICQANERWSGSNPRCKVVDCGSLKTPDHGDVIEQVGTTFGKRIVFECTEVGYKLKGSDIRTCQSNGSWSGTDTTCELVECGDPGNPKNGKQVVSKGYVYGGSVRFECDKDYTITGQNTMYCQANGRWQGSVPECLAPCSDPGFPDQGNRIVEGFRHDQSVTFTCPRGYVMQGAEKIKCSNGRWSANKPSCKDCALPLGMEDKRIADTQITESYRMVGSSQSRLARLNGHDAWCASGFFTPRRNAYIQVEFNRRVKITGISTQGNPVKSRDWVTSYSLKYGQSPDELTWYHGNNRDKKVFRGNNDTDEVVRNNLQEPIVARVLQLVPLGYKRWPCLRMELYGCEVTEEK